MPIGEFDDWGDCMRTMQDERGHDEGAAESICGALEAEAKSDEGDPEALMDALERGAGLIADVGVDLVSGVDVPAVDSKWVMTKDADAHDFRADTAIVLAKDEGEDQRIAYAAAMIPREPDKEGDVVPTPTVEKAAHDFVKQHGGVDTDHSLIDGEGDVVESWVLKEERTFDLPGGETETYPAGTWMVGIEWGKDAWERIKAGELTGLSIYGMAEQISLSKAATCVECGGALSRAKSQSPDTHKGDDAETDGMAQDQGGDSTDDGDPTIDEVAASLDDLSATVESVKETVETEKQDARELAAELGDEYDLPTGDVLDILSAAAEHDAGDVLDAIDSLDSMEESADEDAKADDEDDDDDDEEEQESSVDKRVDDANLDKGSDSRQTAAKGVETDASAGDGLSYRALAEEEG